MIKTKQTFFNEKKTNSTTQNKSKQFDMKVQKGPKEVNHTLIDTCSHQQKNLQSSHKRFMKTPLRTFLKTTSQIQRRNEMSENTFAGP